MQNDLIEKFQFLPDELINEIINYTDVIVYRHGKYMNRINKLDKRYEILNNIPKPIKLSTSKYLLKLINTKEHNKPGYLLEYTVGMYIKINIKAVSYEIDGFDRYLDIKSLTQFIFDINGNWSKIIDYTM